MQTGIWTGSVAVNFGEENGFLVSFSQPYKDTNYIVSFNCEESFCIPMRVAKNINSCSLLFGAYTTNRTLTKANYRIEGYIR